MLQAWVPAKATLEREAALLNASRVARPERTAGALGLAFLRESPTITSSLTMRWSNPYFELDRMIAAMFGVAGRLFGLSFREVTQQPGIELYHPDVRLLGCIVRGQAQSAVHLGQLCPRFQARRRAMSSYRVQGKNSVHGEVIPIIGNHNNFAKAPAGQPSLISFDDVRTLFHEFGHGLHGIPSNVRYERLASTNVYQDLRGTAVAAV